MSLRRASEGQPRHRITTRGWWVIFAILVLALVLVGAWVLGRGGGARGGELGPAASTPTPTPTPTPTIPEIARQEVWRSDTKATNEFSLNTVTAEPAKAAPSTVRYVVKVEKGTEIDPDEAARAVQATFDDERGWAGYGKRNFQLVTDEEASDLTITLASPDTTDALCKPLDTGGKWNCRNGRVVALNSDRWKYMTPTYDDLGTYRAYLVNHEVGHFLGQGHVGCPAEGKPAPVMMQQSIKLGGCTPNAWPRAAD